MIKLNHREDCCGCAACAAACPHGAIRMEPDGMGFKYPVIDKDICVDCGLCEKVCAFKPVLKSRQPKAEAIRFPDYLDKSQSGGLGYALMRKAIGEGMVVYGAAMDDDFVVRHRRVETMEGLEPLRLSKYVQSDMDGIPAKVLKDLKDGRKVLFTGTPCQCAGVGSLCAAFRDNLLLVDLICHGVPSPSVWKSYLEYSGNKEGKKITGALFRDPSLGWHDHRERLFFGEISIISDQYSFLYYRHLMLRPSCGICHFASLERVTDLTIGDSWGVEKANPGFADDNRGSSLLLVSTPSGDDFASEFRDPAMRIPVDIIPYKEMQGNLNGHSVIDKRSNSFEKYYIRRGFPFVIKRFGKDSPGERLRAFMKKVKRHI